MSSTDCLDLVSPTPAVPLDTNLTSFTTVFNSFKLSIEFILSISLSLSKDFTDSIFTILSNEPPIILTSLGLVLSLTEVNPNALPIILAPPLNIPLTPPIIPFAVPLTILNAPLNNPLVTEAIPFKTSLLKLYPNPNTSLVTVYKPLPKPATVSIANFPAVPNP